MIFFQGISILSHSSYSLYFRHQWQKGHQRFLQPKGRVINLPSAFMISFTYSCALFFVGNLHFPFVSIRYAVVTGANKGIGFELCRNLASKGIMVVLTCRDEKKGLEAVAKLKGSGLSDQLVFHQLDVTDPSSISSLADFVKSTFGKLDILVNYL